MDTAWPAARLLRWGLVDLDASRRILSGWPAEAEDLLELLPSAADADQALGLLGDLCSDSDTCAVLQTDAELARRVIGVLGASTALGHHLVRHPELITEELAAPGLPAGEEFEPALAEVLQRDSVPAAIDDLRLAYRRQLLRIAAWDLSRPDPATEIGEVARRLADLADATLRTALSIAAREVGPDVELVRLGVVGLGKCGAQELNYLSDVDVLFVAEPVLGDDGEPVVGTDRAMAIATRWAGALTRVCSAHTRTGTIWEVDAALRPEGKAGPLVRTMASMRGYYERWAKPWEFQAMLKARPVAGDVDLATEFCDLVAEGVWSVGETDGFIAGIQAMRRRVIELIPSRDRGRELKLDEGGLRDVEFPVQLLQLVHGRADERLRVRGTLAGLQALVDGGYVGRSDGADLAEAYRKLRVVEHRAQLLKLRRTHLLPADPDELRTVARASRMTNGEELETWWRATSRQVVSLRRRLFYSPLLAAVARIPTDGLQLTTESAQDQLRALGFSDPRSSLQLIEQLSSGMNRSAQIQRQLLPAMLGWFAEAPNPDVGLLAFSQLSSALGPTSWYLRALRDEGLMAQRLARLLASSRYAVELLRRSPESVQILTSGHDLEPRPLRVLRDVMNTAARRQEDPEKAVQAVRSIRRRELFRIAAADVLGLLDVEQVGRELTEVTTATIEASLGAVLRAHQVEDAPLAVIAMGRWGGRELSYGSDADAMFVIGDEVADDVRSKVAAAFTQLRQLLARPGPDPGLSIDPDLRPEGKGGPMVRSLASYRSYYEKWSSTWEAQALVRAEHGAGSTALSGELLDAVAPLRWPEGGLTETQRREIRKLKARMESERLPRGADPSKHTKLGPGGLSDVEWTIQLLQLDHAAAHPELRTTQTLVALRAARDLGLLSGPDATALEQAWLLASRVRNTAMLVRGRASDSFPTDPRELGAVAELMGHQSGEGSHLLAQYRRVTRRARGVVDRVFWGL